ncbi:Ig-like domain-containing protein, partial [Streptomyces sp. NPDC059828]|uniref:Ig-like domain-containing protein n=1 Tax=Streptomyces sp. NPDC059828 TaxID=3346965 RepID=UPI0036616582
MFLLPQISTAQAAPIDSSGPLTRIDTNSQLQCFVKHRDDTNPAWYGGDSCGTVIALNGISYGFLSTPYTEVSQTGPTGTGTEADPYRLVTVVGAGSGVTLTQTDTYVVGEESYDTSVAVQNNSGIQQVGYIYTVGDCYLGDSDAGYGRVIGSGAACSTSPDPGSRIEALLPRTGGNSYIEGYYFEGYDLATAGQPLPNTCRCGQLIDNGVGLSWPVNLPSSENATFEWTTALSPTGTLPLAATASADESESPPSAINGYTVEIENPNNFSADISTIEVVLPSGFSYQTGTTTGATTNDPVISGQTLTWSGPFTVGGGASITLHFDSRVAATPGTYTIDVNATTTTEEVTPAIDTAPIIVRDLPTTPVIISPSDGSVLADSTPAFAGTGGEGDTVTLTESGTTICTATVDASGEWTCTPTTALADGQHTILPTARDAAGNTAEGDPITITIDTVPPTTPVITSPADGTTLTNSTPAFAGTGG